MIQIFLKTRDLLDARERRNAVLLFGMMLVMGLLDTVGVASILPFIAVVSNPGSIESSTYLSLVYDGLGFSNSHNFLLFIGILVFGLVVTSLTFKALTHWAIARYTHMRNYSISSRLLRGYLSRPYSFFLHRHSADLGKSILSEVQQVIGGALLPGMYFVANAIVAMLLIALVIAVEPVVALTAGLVLGGAYSVTYFLLRRYLAYIGVDRVTANRQRFQIAQEALSGIKEVKVLGLEDSYVRNFQDPARRFARRQASAQIIGQLPRFVLEGLALGGMIAIMISLLALRGGNISGVLPFIALYAFAGMRLLPALQQVYNALTQIRFGAPAVDALHRDLMEAGLAGAPLERRRTPSPDPIRLRAELALSHVHYSYPEADRPALNDLTLTIEAGTTVGLVGSSGAGKTTVVDVILGLLRPQEGALVIDGEPLADRDLRAWQRNIGYVPQSIFLADDTVAANIAFGIPHDEIDYGAVERAARIAALHEFVSQEMPKGYSTRIGERGARISGGQRQRIGIARALYHDPDVLVLDEATSALDNLTEKAVMADVHNLSQRKTIVLVAHRLSTVRDCDKIFMLENGQCVASGAYAELMKHNQLFRAMATVK